MTDPAPARMVSVPVELVERLADLREAHTRLATKSIDDLETEEFEQGIIAEMWFRDLDPAYLRHLASLTPPAPIAAQAEAEAEQAIETLLMQGRGYMPTTYDLVLTARADTVSGLVGVLTAIAYNINHARDRDGHEENEYVGYLFKLLSPAVPEGEACGLS